MHGNRSRQVPASLLFLVILSFPAWFGRFGIRAYFSADDMMNLYGYWSKPVADLLLANVTFWSPYYRPLGGAYYMTIYTLFGMEPLAFHLASFAILGINLFVTFRLVARLTASREAGFLAALAAAHHAGYTDLYYNTGTIYDLLCYLFYLLALDTYASARAQSPRIAPGQWARIVLFYCLALNSKEMAVTFPAILLAYEGIFHGRLIRPRAWVPPLLLSLLLIPYGVSKVSAASPFHLTPAYWLQFTAERFWTNSCRYLEMMLYAPADSVTPAILMYVYGSMLLIAWLLRSHVLAFSVAFVQITPLPVLFIAPRGFFVMYLVVFGWALYLSELATGLLRRLLPAPSPAAVFPLVAVALFSLHAAKADYPETGAQLKTAVEDLRRLRLPVRNQTRLLFLEDRFSPEEWTPLFIVRILHNAPEAVVDRVKMMRTPPSEAELRAYDIVLTDDCAEIRRVFPPELLAQ